MTTTTALPIHCDGSALEGHISTVVFDFGGVFTRSPLALVRRAAETAGVSADALIELMLGGYGTESDHPWQRVERGETTIDEARTWARAETAYRLGVEIDPHDVMSPLFTEPPRQAMIDTAASLKTAGLTTALLTNNVRELRPLWSAMSDWGAIFDHIVDSSEVGLRKPSKEAFELVLDRCSVDDPGRAVMVDDFEVNLDGARAVGMQTVLVGEDPASALATLHALVQR